MIPSRGITRSVPSGIASGLSSSRTIGRAFATRSIPSSRNAAITTGHGMRARLFPAGAGGVAPMALGSVAASRNLSLWGWGSSKASEQAAEQARQAAAAAQEQQAAASSATDAVTDNLSAAAPPPLARSDLSDFGVAADDGLSAAEIIGLSPNESGYLNALGLEYGWGPTSAMQWVLETIHVWTGWGWGMSIVASAFALRAAMLVPQILQMRNAGRLAHMQADPRAAEMSRLAKEAMAEGADGMEKRKQAKLIGGLLKKEYGVNYMNMIGLLIQFPLTLGLFKVIRQMGNLPVPGMESAGYLWFVDLTVRDPYFLLPALATGVMIISLRLGQKYMADTQRNMMKPMMWFIGPIGFCATTFLSAGVNLMGLAFACATLTTSLVLEVPFLRRQFGLLMGSAPSPASATTPSAAVSSSIHASIPKGIRYEAPRGAAPPTRTTAEEVVKPLTMSERLNSSLNDAKQGMSQQLGSFGGAFAATDAEKAERNRKELMKKLEDKRQKQERDEFSRKYKGKK